MSGFPTQASTQLTNPERQLLDVMREIGFGRLERIPVRSGALVLDPWPRTIRHLKLGASDPTPSLDTDREFQLKKQAVEFLRQIRMLESAEILHLEIRHGLPFSMEIEDHTRMEEQGRE